jgi:adenine phosphoribosyltransferase
MDLKSTIRAIPDYPKPGIMFRDVTTLFGDAAAFASAIEQLVSPYRTAGVSKVAGIEARGFILGGAVAHQLNAGFTPIRKRGKLPAATLRQTYALEYGEDEVEIHLDAVLPGERVLLIDDLIATGGTAEAAIKLLTRAGAQVIGAAFVIDLPELGGARRISHMGVPVHALLAFDGH